GPRRGAKSQRAARRRVDWLTLRRGAADRGRRSRRGAAVEGEVAPMRLGHRDDAGGADGGDDQPVTAEKRGRVVAPLGGRGGDDGRQPRGEDAGELIDERGAAVAHARVEELGEERALRAVDRGIDDGERHGNGEPDERLAARLHEPEGGEGEEADAERATAE